MLFVNRYIIVSYASELSNKTYSAFSVRNVKQHHKYFYSFQTDNLLMTMAFAYDYGICFVLLFIFHTFIVTG